MLSDDQLLTSNNLADYDPQGGSLKIRGKGNKEQLASLAVGPQAALDDWLELSGEAPGPRLAHLSLETPLRLSAVHLPSNSAAPVRPSRRPCDWWAVVGTVLRSACCVSPWGAALPDAARFTRAAFDLSGRMGLPPA